MWGKRADATEAQSQGSQKFQGKLCPEASLSQKVKDFLFCFLL